MSDGFVSPTVRSLRDALVASDLPISLGQRLLAVHADGRMVIGVILAGGPGNASEIAKLFLHPKYFSIAELVRQVDNRRIGDVSYRVYAKIGHVEARIQPDRLTAAAFLNLQKQLPAAPSRQIEYDPQTGEWRDSADC